mmetsp:Transcript_24244/g.67406  ORF Transcript_24244/g.67406 Transcript_24244/m.67406 type:complete len:470 (+) Transcript_24244:154-1563(+)|eukprot:CAMPEP_0117682440 /NCGR_PEP_ID=MMETSP0804-20121206/19662_1 /TAXON_ID=1074897 /ORGANISM="Tetraselmis astigmatica, Strain CCMP880" /LENGTH=469 /DNA_ID=CAMNT_0005492555 /DNA_START=82 /DNA_END=1491 /DNA_ORIENTATION=+
MASSQQLKHEDAYLPEVASVIVALDTDDVKPWMNERWGSDEDEGEELEEGTTLLLRSEDGTASTTGVEEPRRKAVSQACSALGPVCALLDWFWNAGLLCCVVSALFFSCNAVLVKLLHNVPVFQIALARSSVSLVFTYSLMSANKIYRLCSSASNLPWLVLRGTTGSSAMLMFYVGLQTTPLADAQSTFFMYPALTAVMSFVFLGERLWILQALGVAASVAGVVLIAHPPILFGGHSDWGPGRGMAMAFLVGSAFAAASAITIIRKLSATESSIIMALWFHLTALAVSIPALAIGWPKPPVLDLELAGWLCLVGVACTSFIAQLLFNRGIQLMTGATAACIASLQVPLAHMWGTVLFHEVPTAFSIGGTALVIAGLVAVNQGKQDPSTATEEGGVAAVAPAVAVIHLIRSRSQALLQRAASLGRCASLKKMPGNLTPDSSAASTYSDLIECEDDLADKQRTELELVASH